MRTRLDYERPLLCRADDFVLRGQRPLCPVVRTTLGTPMETIVVGAIALLLFVYLFTAMVRPEKF